MVRLVKIVLSEPGAPTLRISRNSAQRGRRPPRVRVTRLRPEARYPARTREPAANDATLATAAPATPSRGSGPQPVMRAGDRARYTAPLPTITRAGRVMLPVPRTTEPRVL